MNTEQAAVRYICSLFQGNAGGHDAAHSLRVYRNALLIAEKEGEGDREVIALAALLHDADDHKLFRTEDNANARTFLEEHGVTKIPEILAAVNAVSFSQNRGRRPTTPEGRIVQDADRLDAIGAIGIARAFAFGGEHGRSLDATIRHFGEKLLLLRDGMNTRTGRELAEERHRFMEQFLERYCTETGEGGAVPAESARQGDAG